MIVVDVNVIAYLLIHGTKSQQAAAVFSKDSQWRVPTLWQDEFLNVLVMQVRQRGITHALASQTLGHALQFLSRSEQPVNKFDALRVATQHQITGYDAQYVALAESLGATMVSEDSELLRKFPHRVSSMKSFCAI